MSVLNSRLMDEKIIKMMNDAGTTIPGINAPKRKKGEVTKRTRKLRRKDLRAMGGFNMPSE